MQGIVKAIFFDIGGTLRVTNPDEGRDLYKDRSVNGVDR